MKIIEEICQRFEQDNATSFANLFTENATYFDSLYGTYKGRQAIKAFHEKCHKEATAYKFQPVTVIFQDRDHAAFEWNFAFVSLMPQSKGKKITLKGASFVTLEGGKILSYREYADSIALLLAGNVPDKKILEFYRRKYPNI